MVQALTTLQKLISSIYSIKQLFNVFDPVRTKSLIETTSALRVEPLTVISRDALTVDYLQDVMQTLFSLFTGYYMLGLSVVGNIHDSRVVKTLGRLNPNVDSDSLFLSTENFKTPYLNGLSTCAEAYTHRLPTSKNKYAIEDTLTILQNKAISQEADTIDNNTPSEEVDTIDKTASFKGGDFKYINDPANLAVGKFIDVKLTFKTEVSKGKDKDIVDISSSIPINIRLIPAIVNNKQMDAILSLKSTDVSLTERFHSWWGGEISFSDLMFASDLIDEYRKNLIDDETGIMEEIATRVTKAKAVGFVNGTSLVSASSMFVITDSVVKSIEYKMGGKFKNKSVRDKVFEGTYAMIIAVIDREWDTITFYYRGIDRGTECTVKDIKKISKTSDNDIMSIFKALTSSNAPSF